MRKKILKVSGIVMGVLVVLTIIGVVAAQRLGPSYLLEYVRDRVEKETMGRYTLTLDTLEFDLWSMSVHLGELTFDRDSSVGKYCGIPLLDKFDTEISFSSLHLNYFHLLKFAFDNSIRVEELLLQSPSVVIRKNLHYNPDLAEEVRDSLMDSRARIDSLQADSILADTAAMAELRASGSGLKPFLDIDRLMVTGGYFAFYDGVKREPLQEVNGLQLMLAGVHSEEDAPFDYKGLDIRIDSAHSLVSKNIAILQIVDLHINPDVFHLDKLHYGHLVDPYRINAIKGFRAAWLDVEVRDIDLSGIDYERLVADSSLIIEKVAIGEVDLHFFKDKSELVINPAHKPLPPELIRNIPLEIEIDTITLGPSQLFVEMQAAKAVEPGVITFEEVVGNIYNVTNRPAQLANNPVMEAHFHCMINGVIDTKLNYRFQLDSPESQYSCTAEVGSADVPVLNGFVGSQFFIEFKSGYVEGMSFQFEGDNKANVGQMELKYRNLKIRKLKNFRKYLEGHPNTGVLSSIGNLIIPHNHTKDKKNYKPAVMYYEKDYNRDVVHATIQTMLSGFMSAMGIGPKNLEKKQEQAENLTREDVMESAAKAEAKAERAKKKMERRAERKARKENQ